MKRLLMITIVTVCLSVPMSVFAHMVGGGDIIFTPKNALPVVFSHDKHVDVKGLKCTACHYQIFQMARESYKMDMNKLKEGSFCGKCHNGQIAFDVKDKKNCIRCHR
jgi:c(7)-type cytochrome triheme protein